MGLYSLSLAVGPWAGQYINVPLQFVQCILFFFTAMSLWSYLLYYRDTDPKFTILIITNVLLVLAVGWTAT
ncbi:MAG: hypothetical protein ACYDEQ_13860, partial [Desulfocucumaceae bacterium]